MLGIRVKGLFSNLGLSSFWTSEEFFGRQVVGLVALGFSTAGCFDV